MSIYLELPELNPNFPVRSFINSGQVLVYPHWHKEIEFIYVIRGIVKIGVNDQIIELKEGEIYFFESGVVHYFLASPDSERIVYQFDLKIFDEPYFEETTQVSLSSIFDTRENHSLQWSDEVVE